MSFPEAEADRRKLIAFRHGAKDTTSMSKLVDDFAIQLKKKQTQTSWGSDEAANTNV